MANSNTAQGLVALACLAFKNGNIADAGSLFANAMMVHDSTEFVRALVQQSEASLSVESSDNEINDVNDIESLASISREISLSMEQAYQFNIGNTDVLDDSEEGADGETV